MPDPYEASPISQYTQSFGSNQLGFSTSGSTSANTTANWRIHVQNVEIMYKRIQTYSTTTGQPEFNYLDCNVSIGSSNEHKYWNASGGDMMQLQTLDLVSSGAASGSFGTSGIIRTSKAGLTRREVRADDVESRTYQNINLVANRQPGTYASSFDLSGGTNSTIMDIILRAEAVCPEFELDLVSL